MVFFGVSYKKSTGKLNESYILAKGNYSSHRIGGNSCGHSPENQWTRRLALPDQMRNALVARSITGNVDLSSVFRVTLAQHRVGNGLPN